MYQWGWWDWVLGLLSRIFCSSTGQRQRSWTWTCGEPRRQKDPLFHPDYRLAMEWVKNTAPSTGRVLFCEAVEVLEHWCCICFMSLWWPGLSSTLSACWDSRLRVANTSWLELIRKPSDVVGVELDSHTVVQERRMLSKQHTILENVSHLFCEVLVNHRITFSQTLSIKKHHRAPCWPIKLYNSSPSTTISHMTDPGLLYFIVNNSTAIFNNQPHYFSVIVLIYIYLYSFLHWWTFTVTLVNFICLLFAVVWCYILCCCLCLFRRLYFYF